MSLNLTQQDIDRANNEWQESLADINNRFNPNHAPAGPGGGEFTTGSGDASYDPNSSLLKERLGFWQVSAYNPESYISRVQEDVMHGDIASPRAAPIIEAIRNETIGGKQMYRGLHGVPEHADILKLKVGDVEEIPPSSWTTDNEIATIFSTTATDESGVGVFITVTGSDTHGIELGERSLKDASLKREKEVISGGRFKVVSVTPVDESRRAHIELQQIGVY